MEEVSLENEEEGRREERGKRGRTNGGRARIPAPGEPSASDPLVGSRVENETSLGDDLAEHDLTVDGSSTRVVESDLAGGSSISSVSSGSRSVGAGGEISTTAKEGGSGGLGDVAVAERERKGNIDEEGGQL